MNILWHSNSPSTPSGYGNQTKLFTTRLAKAGHQVSISAFYGREGSILRNEDGLLELPRGTDLYGNDIIAAHLQYVGAELAFSLIDPFVLRGDVWGHLPWAAWVPVDTEPVLPQSVNALKAAKWVIAMSRFGQEELRKAGFDPLYLPHGIETNVYKPEDRELARAQFRQYTGHNLDGKFLVMTVAANKGVPSRKNFSGMLDAFARFAAQHPEALFYLHTETEGIWQGENIYQIAQFYGIADKIITPAQYHIVTGLVSSDLMNHLYNAADVFLLLSRGEGFGIPLVEAQSAGCPVVTTRFTANTELCFTGWRVDGTRYSFVPGTEQLLADPAHAAAALNEMYLIKQKGEDEALRALTRQYALKYDVDTVFETYFQPILARIEQDLHPPVQPQRITHHGTQHTSIRPYSNGLTLYVRDGERYAADVDIVHEVQTAYFPDVLDYSQVQTAIDVGGHIGAFSLWLKQASPEAHIALVEQDADNAWLARRNLAAYPDVAVYEGRCGYRTDDLVVARHAYNGAWHRLVGREEAADLVLDDGSTPEVADWQGETYSLEQLMAENQFERIHLLKLDCEGSELDILRGASPDTLERIDAIVGEYHQGQEAFLTAVGDILHQHFDRLELREAVHPQASGDLGLFLAYREGAYV